MENAEAPPRPGERLARLAERAVTVSGRLRSAKTLARPALRAARQVSHPVRVWRCSRGLARPGFEHYLALAREGREFAFLRRTHGFWDRLVDASDLVPEVRAAVTAARMGGPAVDERVFDGLSAEQKHELQKRNWVKGFWESEGYAAELIHDLQHPHRDEGYIEAVQFCPGMHSVRRLREVYGAFHTSGVVFHDALVWRRAVMDGHFAELFEALRADRVVVVGPPEKASLGELVGLPTFEHVEIHPNRAFASRHETLNRVRAAVRRRPASTAVLFEAASLASWLIHRLWEDGRPRVMLDIGRALDIWYPETIRRQDWFKRSGGRMVRNMGVEDLYR